MKVHMFMVLAALLLFLCGVVAWAAASGGHTAIAVVDVILALNVRILWVLWRLA